MKTHDRITITRKVEFRQMGYEHDPIVIERLADGTVRISHQEPEEMFYEFDADEWQQIVKEI